jgi:hypothetical protein
MKARCQLLMSAMSRYEFSYVAKINKKSRFSSIQYYFLDWCLYIYTYIFFIFLSQHNAKQFSPSKKKRLIYLISELDLFPLLKLPNRVHGGDYFLFDLVLIQKKIQTKFFFLKKSKSNRNRFKLTGFSSIF